MSQTDLSQILPDWGWGSPRTAQAEVYPSIREGGHAAVRLKVLSNDDQEVSQCAPSPTFWVVL